MEGEPQSLILLSTIFNSDIAYYIINGCVLMLLLFLSAIVSGSEVAFFSVTPNEIEDCLKSDSKKDKRIVSLLKNPKRLLATILIFNNFVNVGIVTISTFLSWEIFKGQSEGMLIAAVSVVITIVIVFFGEVIPKVYANNESLSFARKTSLIINISSTLFRPLSFLLMSLTNIIENRIEKKRYNVSVEELNHALEITTQEDQATTEEQKEILKGIVNFGTYTVPQVMTSRIDITAFDEELGFHELLDKVNKSGFSRIPIYEDRIDNIKGILYIKDILPHLEKGEGFKWQDLLRETYFVPESKKIDGLLKDFQEKRVHMAVVVDEYGGVAGLVTLEDVIEEIVGEINDEFDADDVIYTKISENSYVFEGKTSLMDFCKIIDTRIDFFEEVKGESESLGGLVLEINSSMPKVGEVVTFKNFTFKIESVNSKRIKKVKIEINEEIIEEE